MLLQSPHVLWFGRTVPNFFNETTEISGYLINELLMFLFVPIFVPVNSYINDPNPNPDPNQKKFEKTF